MDWDASPERMSALREAIQLIRTQTPLSQALSEDFPRECTGLPISGGWGYSQPDAIRFVRDRFPPIGPLDFVSLEYLIAQKIIYEELIIFHPREAGYSRIKMALDDQQLIGDGNKHYDRLDVAVSCWSAAHWNALKAEWEGNDFGRRPGFDVAAHEAKRAQAEINYTRPLWFDITEVFGGR
jgi:hypothetical protein